MNRLKRSIAWVLLLSLFLQILSPLVPARAFAAGLGQNAGPTGGVRLGDMSIAQTESDHPIQALLLYNRDTAAAQTLRALLEANGVAVTLRQLGEDPTQPDTPTVPSLFVPAVTRGDAPEIQATSRRAQSDALATFDVILLGDDLEEDGILVLEAALRQEILEAQRPVIGLGRGGTRFLVAADLLATGIVGAGNAGSINLCDRGAGTPLFQGENSLPLDQATYSLYTEAPATAYAVLPERVPQTRRLACADTSAEDVAILLLQDRFALWGFSAGPDHMTETGQALFVNLIWLLAGENVEIPLAAGSLRPTPGIEQALLDALAQGEAQYVLLQLYRLPTQDERDLLAELGIELLAYLAQNTYSAKIRPDANFDHPLVEDLLRFAGLYRPEYKLHPELSGEFQEAYGWAAVYFFPDVAPDAITALLSSIFGDSYSQGPTPTTWIVPNDGEKLAQLAQSSLVRFIAPLATPEDFNENARPVVGTQDLQSASIAGSNITYTGLTGQGITLGIFERRPLATHGDLTGRIITGAFAHADVSSHGTHVAGIIMGNGAISEGQGLGAFQRRGHAPHARLVTQSYGTDATGTTAATQAFVDRFADSVLNHGVRSSNHSYLQSQGLYDAGPQGIDVIIRGDAIDSNGNVVPPNLAVFAAGNNGQGISNNQGNITGFYSMFAAAKNSLAVGSTDADTGAKSNFSSKGPTYDGRIKPDVVAPGCRDSAPATFSRIMSTDTANGNTYGGKCGTSMATPVVTGITGLMLEQYRNTFGASFNPLPSSLKALLVNTAVDQIGTAIYNDPDCNCAYDYAEGPDWATGYGLVDAPAAIAAIRARNIIEGVVSPTNLVDTYTIEVSAGRPELRFTLAWDDEPGDTATAATTRKLINDLDLVLIDPNGNQHLPWVLDPLPVTNNPSANGNDPISMADINNNPAFRDVNTRDNVEQVVVNNPIPGTWQIQVSASALPNLNPQSYSLAGEFRELNVIRPNTSNIADAGDPATPNVILVRLAARQPQATPDTSSMVDATAADFQVEIEGIPADVINGLAVGDQFWLNVRPASGQYNAGSKYDLQVTWIGRGSDSKTRAVIFTEREVTDRAIVVDYSGSMTGYDKMQAAQNASRLFIDQSLPGDRVSVVGFSTNVITPYPIAEVSNDPLTPELNAAKNAVDGLIPGGLTAIGPGLLEGQKQVTIPRANPAEEALLDVIILLSDGMENVDPRYNTPDVKGEIQPTDTIVHTVGVGPANAGFFSLLQTIADDNDGLFFSVTETAPGAGSASIAAATAGQAVGIDALPVELPNRLAEAYKHIAENVLRETRIYQAGGNYTPVFTHVPPNPVWRFVVPDNTARLNIALNWSNEHAFMRMIATAPDDTVFAFDPKNSKDATCRSDKTHEVCIIDNPAPGVWRVDGILPQGFTQSFEYFLWVSGQTPVQFHLHIGTPAAARLPGASIHVIGFVHQSGKPLPGPETGMIVKVYDANGEDVLGEVKLLDDGMSQDGAAGDGIFGGTFIAPNVPGPYQVRGVTRGENAEGQQFELFANTGFHLRPRTLYVHHDDVAAAEDYRTWIQAHGLPVDLAHKDALPSAQEIAARYSLVILGPDTAEWSDVQVRPILASEIRVLGLGKGGYSYLRFLQFPTGEASEGHSIAIGDYQDDIWFSDYEFNIEGIKLMQIYAGPTTRIDIPEKSQGINAIFGTNPENTTLATLLQLNHQITFWGFQDSPKAMTDTGRELFINTLLRAMR